MNYTKDDLKTLEEIMGDIVAFGILTESDLYGVRACVRTYSSSGIRRRANLQTGSLAARMHDLANAMNEVCICAHLPLGPGLVCEAHRS